MKLRFPPTRYRVVRDEWLGYEAQFRPWWSPAWIQCSCYNGGCGINTKETIEEARQLCADHANRRPHLVPRSQVWFVGQVVAQFSARELQ